MQCKACTRGHYAYPPWCTGEPSPARIVTCRVVSTAHARRQGSACGAPLPVWELDPLQFEGGRLETEVQWRGALSISKGGGQKSKGGGGRSATLCRFGWNPGLYICGFPSIYMHMFFVVRFTNSYSSCNFWNLLETLLVSLIWVPVEQHTLDWTLTVTNLGASKLGQHSTLT